MGQAPPKTENPIRIGILGAANIAASAIIDPCKHQPDAVIHAISARNFEKAADFGKKHNIPIVFKNYVDLLNDPNLDAVYIPLPNSLHFEWAKKAIELGKHVLCEKPLTSNAEECEELQNLLKNSTTPIVFLEAFHYRYHPAALQFKELLKELGEITEVRAVLDVPLLFLPGNQNTDIRFKSELAGGALMDLGCYCINAIRYFGGEIEEVTSATAVLHSIDKNIDNSMSANFKLANGIKASIYCGFQTKVVPSAEVVVTSATGKAKFLSFVFPHIYSSITLQKNGSQKSYTVAGEFGKSTYWYQLDAFCKAIRRVKAGEPWEKEGEVLTGIEEALLTMKAIDRVYEAAGMKRRMKYED